MKAHIRLLEYIIDMWDPDQEHFMVGVHILPIEVEDIYFLISLSIRGIPVVLFGAQGREGSLDDILDQHCSLGIESQSRKLQIKSLVDLAREAIHKGKNNASGTVIDYLIDIGSGKIVFWTNWIQIPKIDKNPNGTLFFVHRDYVGHPFS